MVFKFCGGCKTTLSVDLFPKSKNQNDGLNTQCKKCARERAKKWYLENKEKNKQYRLVNKERIAKRKKQYRSENKEKIRKE